jgi:hypothetical protein
MELDRNELARVDRRLLAELDGDGGVQMVKVPVSDAVWSVWRRYCDAVGVTMGEGVAALIEAELATVIGDDPDRAAPVFVDRAVRRAVEATERLEERQRELAECRQRLVERDREVRDLSHRLRTAIRPPQPSAAPIEGRTGRNERCPCGSGLKYKHCHGLPGRQQRGSSR